MNAAHAFADTGEVRYDLDDDDWPFSNSENSGADRPAGGDRTGSGGEPGNPAPRASGGGDGSAVAGADGPSLADLPREQAGAFIDPDGDAAKAQGESLAHDARAALDQFSPPGAMDQRAPEVDPSVSTGRGEGGTIAAKDKQDNIDPNIAARQQQEAQLGAQAPLRELR